MFVYVKWNSLGWFARQQASLMHVVDHKTGDATAIGA